MTDRDPDLPSYPSFLEAAKVWAKIGFLSFGGPAGQIALMHRELVEQRRWISESRFLHALNYCMLLPGPEAQQLATYIGWLLHGTRGGIVAGTLFVLPGFVVILVLSASYALFQQTEWLPSLFFGLTAAVLAVVIEAVIRVGRRALKNNFMISLAGIAFLAIFVFSVPFPLVVLVSGLVGYFGTKVRPDLFKAGGHKGNALASERPALIDANVPDIAPTWGRSLSVVSAWGALWVAPLVIVFLIFGPQNIYIGIIAFFSQMAVVTFGGAYAVLAYVAQLAVEQFGWLEPGEMLDGLAMAETTPGPLVMVLSFVGFMAAFRHAAPLDPLSAGLLGATITTWVTFVPCFLWIFLGAPYIERLRSNVALSGALTAITGAVVGVILNLAIWFAIHVIFSRVDRLNAGWISVTWPDWASFDLAAATLSVLAALLLLVWHRGMLQTLAICGVLGFAFKVWLS